jgi:hypothetical protein
MFQRLMILCPSFPAPPPSSKANQAPSGAFCYFALANAGISVSIALGVSHTAREKVVAW